MKKFLSLGIISISLFFVSCEGNTNRAYHVANQSSETVKVYVNHNYYGTIDTFEINANSTSQILEYDQRGGSDNTENLGNLFTELIIVNSQQDTCLKSHIIDENWSILVDEKNRVPSEWEHDYTFSISDLDF